LPVAESRGGRDPGDPESSPRHAAGRPSLIHIPALGALQFREFRLLWMSQLTTAIGQWMDQVARGWLLYDLTGSPLQLGLVGMIRIFPLLLLSPIAGTLADRYGRKTQLIIAQVVNVIANVILGLLILHDGVEPWHVYATGLVSSTVSVFQQPARQAMVPESVDQSHLTNAIGLNSIAFNVSRMLGPAAAGIIIAMVGPGGSYLTQAVIYLLSTVWTMQLRLPNRAPTSAAVRAREGSSFATSTMLGWRYVIGHQTIRTGLIVSVVISFFGFSVNSLLPVFAKDVLAAGPTGQGALLAAMGIGAVLSAFFVATAGDDLPKGMLMVGGVTLYGLSVMGFAASHWLGLSMGLMVIVGVCNVMSNTLIQTVLQAISAPEMRGRVMGVYQQHQVLIAIGGLAAGALATVWGAQMTVGAFGAACALGALLVWVLVPHVRTIR
jgi:MFS family permease